MKHFLYWVMFFIGTLPYALSAEPLTSTDNMTGQSQLTAFAEGIRTLRGQFTQQSYDTKNNLVDVTGGSFALKAPRQFRWEYIEPFPQLIIADGLNIWIYDEDLAQVTVRGQSIEETQSPLTVITDLSLLERDYHVKELPAVVDQVYKLELIPKAKEPAFVKCVLAFKENILISMTIFDHMGQKNQWHFSKWERNPALNTSLFEFKVPAGVDLVGNPVKGAEAFAIPD